MTRRTRHLRPRLEHGSWAGGALPDNGDPHGDEADGYCVVFQWLGLIIEIGAGRVRSTRNG